MPAHTPLMPTPNDVAACMRWPRSVAWTGRGPVQYADRGTGSALLSVHGTPGGCDQGLLMAEFFRANGFRVLAPSRPGYLGTPLAAGRTPQEQADMLAALLDALHIERAGVLGTSGGGPSTYLLAARYPDRVSCLVQVASLAMPWSPSADFARGQRVTLSRLGNRVILWLFDNHPSLLGRLTGHQAGEQGRALREDPYRWAALRAIIATAGGKQPRRAGYENDLHQFATLSPLPPAITCPTLLVHGTADTIVAPAHSEHAAAHIPGAEMLLINQGTHLSALGDDATPYQHALDWLTAHADEIEGA